MRIKVLYEWLLQSNRLSHVKAGMLIFLLMIVFCFFFLDIKLDKSAIISSMITAITAVSVDYKDKLWGGKFDWLDIVATVLLPCMLTIICCVLTFLL